MASGIMLAEIFNCSAEGSKVEFSSFQLGRTIEEGDKVELELQLSLYVELVEELRREKKITWWYMDKTIEEILLGGRDEISIVNLLQLYSILFYLD